MSRRPALSSGRSVLAQLLAELQPPEPPPVIVRRRRELRLPPVPPWAGRAVAVGALASAGAVGLSVSTATVAEAVPWAAAEPVEVLERPPSREVLAARAVELLPSVPPLAPAAEVSVPDRALVPVALPGWSGVGELWSAVVPGQEGRAVVVLPVDPVATAGLVDCWALTGCPQLAGQRFATLADHSEWRVVNVGPAPATDLSALTDVEVTVPMLTLVSGIAGDPRRYIDLRKVDR